MYIPFHFVVLTNYNDAIAATVKFSVTNVTVNTVRLQFCAQSLPGKRSIHNS